MPDSLVWINLFVKSTILIAAAAVAVWMLRRRSAAEGHLVWTLTLLALTALPLLERGIPRSLSWSPVSFDAPLSRPASNEATAPAGKLPDFATEAGAFSLGLLWAAGACLTAAYYLFGYMWLLVRYGGARQVDGEQPRSLLEQELIRHGVRRKVRLRETPHRILPMTWGIIRPVILLPSEARTWAPERLRVILAHKTAHIARHDSLTQLFAQAVCVLYWFQPLAWLAARSQRRLREQACDDAVLTGGEPATQYAAKLLELARWASSQSSVTGAVFMANPAGLEARLQAALDPLRRRHPTSRPFAAGLALCLAFCLFPLASFQASAQSATGHLIGRVQDISLAAVPDAVIIVSLDNTNKKEITQSAPDGEYAFLNLAAGTYTLEVRKPGFAAGFFRNVTVIEGQTQAYVATLEMGRVSDTISVIGKGPLPAVAQRQAPRRVRVGGHVQATKLVYALKPVYPQHLQQQGVQGTVLLEGVISIEGGLLSLRSVNSLVHPELTEAAMSAVRQWRYEPSLLNGKPVEVITTVTVNFKLEQ